MRDGQELPVERRVFELLSYLIAHQDRVVSKEELVEKVWEVRALADGVLSNTVAKLRRVLGQRAEDKHPIETVHGRGYRFRAGGYKRPPVAAEQAPAAVPSQPLPALTPRDPFVGRDTLMQALRERLQNLDRRSENLVILAGDAGVGKTRTAREFARSALELGLRVWSGAAHEGKGAPPYWPWTQVLRAAHEELGDAEFRACLPSEAWTLSVLVPELCAPSPEAPRLEPEAGRFLLFEAVSRFLKKAAHARPLLIIVDDLHCADRGTIELLRFATRALLGRPLTFLATVRTGESAEGADEQAPLPQLARVASVLELRGLSAEAVAELTSTWTGSARAELALTLHGCTQGNPLFVRHILEQLLERGDGSQDQSSLPNFELPPTLRPIIRRRLLGLPDPARRVVAAAAVAGKEFDTALVAQVLELEAGQVLERLEPALRLGVIEARPPAPDAFAFAHELVRASLYDELGLRERGELHSRVAQVLAHRQGRDARHLAALAHHLLNALPFDLAAATSACRAAAAAARETSSFDAAAEILSAVIARLDPTPADSETRFGLLLELGQDYFHAGLTARAWKAFRNAAGCARQFGRRDLLAQAAPRLVDCLAFGLGSHSFARAVVEQALASDEPQPDAVKASLLARRAELALELSVEERGRLLDRAASLAEQSAAPEAILEVAHARAVLRDPTRLPDNTAAADRLLALTEREADAATGRRVRSMRRFDAYSTRYLCALTACDLAAADEALGQCRQLAENSQVRAARLVVNLMRAGRALGDDSLVELQKLIPAPTPKRDLELPLERGIWTSYRAALLEVQGTSLEAGTKDLELDALARLGSSRFTIYAAIGRARWFALTGKLRRARAVLAQIPHGVLDRMPVQYGDLGALCALVEVRLALADLASAQPLYDKLSPYAGLNAVGPCYEYSGAVAHFLGLMARALGRSETASDHFRQALALNRKLGMPRQMASSERELRALRGPLHARV